MPQQAENRLTWQQCRQLSNTELLGIVLIVLSFALLPIGRVVEISTSIMATGGLILISSKQSRLWLLNNKAAQFFSVLFALFWLPMLISLIGTETIKNSTGFSLKYLRFFLAGLYIVYSLKSSTARNLVLSAISITIALWLLDSVVQWLTGRDLLGHSYISSRLTGPFSHLTMPIILSLFLPMTLIFTNTRWPSYAFVTMLMLSVLIIFLAGSRASWIALTLYGLLYSAFIFIRSPKNPILMFVLLISGTLAIGMAGYKFDKGIKGRVDSASKLFSGDYDSMNKATSLRLPIWEVATKIAIDNPINGVGVKGFHDKYRGYAKADDPFKEIGASHPHLFILEVLVETGLIGVAGLLIVATLLYRLSRNNLYRWSRLQAGAAISLVITFFPLNAHTSLYGSLYSQIAWLITAIACAWLFETKQQEYQKS